MNLLREKRLAVGMSQTEVANLAGMANSYISDFELGKRQPWPLARRRLARALKCKETDLFPKEQNGDQ